MIKSLTNKDVWEHKVNWIDQNNVVVGYDSRRQCCENFGWGVYDPSNNRHVAADPAEMPYHFGEVYENPDKFYGIEKREWSSFDQNVVQVELIPDDDAPAGTPPLIMEFYNEHNGFYSHDFSIEQIKKESK